MTDSESSESSESPEIVKLRTLIIEKRREKSCQLYQMSTQKLARTTGVRRDEQALFADSASKLVKDINDRLNQLHTLLFQAPSTSESERTSAITPSKEDIIYSYISKFIKRKCG